MRLALALLACVLGLGWALVPAAAQATSGKPSSRTLYHDGPTGRYLLDGEWLFRLDAADQGRRLGFARSRSTAGWSTTVVPSAWNVGDDSNESMAGSIGWYRKDFRLPSARAALTWIVRFESVNYRTQVWLNGKRVGQNRGAYIPFELLLGNGLKRKGVNRLVVRVDSRRHRFDFPPAGLTASGVPSGGWWNYGGIIREVYLRKVDMVDFKQVLVRPRLACPSCDAKVRLTAVLRNYARRRARVAVSARFGRRAVALGTQTVPAGGSATFTSRFTVRDPRLWSPAKPNLYAVELAAQAGGRRVGRYRLNSGVRSIRVTGDGRLLLNGQPVDFRGVGYHEDSKQQGFAIDNAVRERLVAEAEAIGATLMRTHYPPHPYLHELADRAGILIWSEVPVYSIPTDQLARQVVRKLAATEIQKNIESNQNHPSVLLWSIANELDSKPGPTQAAYIRRAAGLAKRLDPTRPTAIAVAGYLTAGCQPEYAPVDVIGVNEYFGWYPGPGGQIFDRARLSGYLDGVRACYPRKAVVISEFGAEANRDGPVEEKGTWAHQQDFVNFHLGVYATKPWLSGAIYWAINEFRIRPDWEGGNPRPLPPLHQKALTRYGTWERKPAWFDVQRWFAQTRQYGDAPRAPAR